MELRDFIVLVTVLIIGGFYYLLNTSKREVYNRFAIIYKIFVLAISFICEFIKSDFVVLGKLAFGGRSVVLLLIMFEVVDSIIDIKEINEKEKRRIRRLRNRRKKRIHRNEDDLD